MAKDARLYGKFTLNFPRHPKIAILSDAAFRCLVEATLYSRDELTDGLLARRYAVARWGLDVLQELCQNDDEKPSLIEVEKGWLIHDYAEHQDTKEEVEARSARNKAAGQKGGLAKSKQRAKQPASKSLSESVAETEAETETHTASGYVRDDSHPSNARDTVNVDPAPEHIDNAAAKPTKRQPSSAARTVVRHELGNVGQPYPRATHDRLAVQVDKLAADHPDTVIREALRDWDKRDNALPEWLPTVLGDVVKRSRAAPTTQPTSKLRATANLAARQRAREQAAALVNGTTAIKELE